MSLWYGWGDAADALTLPPRVADLLEQVLGVGGDPAPPPVLTDVRLPEARLDPAVLTELAGVADVSADPEARIRHTRGKSTVDLLRIRTGEADEAPDAVVAPADHDAVQAVLEICGRHRVAVVPYGGGTSVVGGLAPTRFAMARGGFEGIVSLDLHRLSRLVSVDPISRVAVLEAGVRAPDAERLLAEHGLSLGHFPQSFEYATIGGFAATRSSGQFSAGYGRFDEMVVGLRVATPTGTVRTGRAPRSAAGPDLRQLFLGSEGVLGVITEVAVRVHPIPTATTVRAFQLPSFVDSFDAVRRLAQDGPLPTMIRLSDETETLVNAPGVNGCLALLATDSPPVALEGAMPLPETVGQEWLRNRYQAPYLRDALLSLGALAETLETATFWSGLPGLYEAVRTALTEALTAQGTPPVVLCHISHVYATGASLYFTVAAKQAPDPVVQWRMAKEAANRAILDAGGTITHHHAVGTDHAAAYAEEIGPLGLAALRAVKASLDPVGILNPGVLLGLP